MTAREPLWPAIVLGWALACAVFAATNAMHVYMLDFPDPDDAMRLLEVRDLLAGQSWWDVTQYRLASGDMHWSRLVDLPIAGVILLAEPIAGQAMAERIALVLVPLATMLIVFALGAQLTRRMLDATRARLAILIAPLSVPMLYQLRPMRIDHHGWQIALALCALYFLVGRATLRNGLLMGASLAALITISLEGLPAAAALGGLAALAWAFDPTRRSALIGCVWSLFLSAALLQLATRGLRYSAPMCDALTADWILVLGVAAGGVTLASLSGRAPLPVRLASLALAGAAAIATLLTRAPECVAGPFAQLDPLTHKLWYVQVSEGRPVWEQVPGWAALTIGLPLVGLIGSWGAMAQSEGQARTRWLLLIGAQLAATLLAIMVMRAGATANAFALPGTAWLLERMLRRARAVPSPGKRIAATAAALLLASPGLLVIMVLGISDANAARQAQKRYIAAGRPVCTSGVDARAVGALPPGLIFAPLDISPGIVATTHHRAVASGHHRNMAAMHDVMAAFTGTPAQAERVIRRHRARYLLVCPGLNEPEIYRQESPNGFWARLDRGEPMPWLRPVRIAGSPVLVWEVLR